MPDLLVSPVNTPDKAPCLFSEGKQTFSLLLMMFLAGKRQASRHKDEIRRAVFMWTLRVRDLDLRDISPQVKVAGCSLGTNF